MESINRTLFHYAPHELSHSAFWAWVLSKRIVLIQKYAVPRKLAEAFFNDIGVSDDKQVIDVDTEVMDKKKNNRFDIVVYFQDNTCLIIENKVSSGLDYEQLKCYEELAKLEIDNDNEYRINLRVFMFTGYDFGYRSKLESKYPMWQVIDSYQVKEMLDSIINLKENDILREYSLWIDSQHRCWSKIKKDLFSKNSNQVYQSLGKSIGQWELFNEIFNSKENKYNGNQYNGVNIYVGTPWTEFCFYLLDDPKQGDYDLNTEYPDSIFYRIDSPPKEELIKITMKQYLEPGNFKDSRQWNNDQVQKGKKKRLMELREHFMNALKKTEPRSFIEIIKPHNRGKMESEIGVFLFKSEKDLSNLIFFIRQFHSNILDELNNSTGWDLSKSRYGHK